jgi:hypothetical protein
VVELVCSCVGVSSFRLDDFLLCNTLCSVREFFLSLLSSRIVDVECKVSDLDGFFFGD